MMNWRAVNALARWLRQAAAPPRFWWFSRSEDELRRWWRRRASEPADLVEFHARLPAAELSRRLQQVTIGLALYVDGASTRRSTLAALLEHRLPVVGLDDRYTDDRLRGSGALALVQPDRVPEVPRAIERLLPDASRRREMSDAAAQLFDRDLAWPRIAAAYQALEAAR
jgi:glycosyltransferase involved in cell wall biosynthesis